MNPITFNDIFTEALAGQSAAERFKGWETAPLCVHNVTQGQVEARNEQLHVSPEGIPLMHPFPIYRFFGKSGDTTFKAIIKPATTELLTPEVYNDGDEGIAMLALDILLSTKDGIKGMDPKLRARIGLPVLWGDNRDSDERSDLCIRVHDLYCSGPGKWASAFGTPELLAELRQQEAAKSLLARVSLMALDFAMSAAEPNTHMVSVEPEPGGEKRSVQWTKARTHFTFISHGHPANKKGVGHGERVKDDGKELHRMAHNRRAHWKTYKHERYRFMKGKRQFIKATWVGPKEWRDEGGKQIYRILEPVDQAPVISV